MVEKNHIHLVSKHPNDGEQTERWKTLCEYLNNRQHKGLGKNHSPLHGSKKTHLLIET